MQRREFCDLLSELLERSGYSLSTDEYSYDWDEEATFDVNYHTPEELVEAAGCIPCSSIREECDPLYIYLNCVLPEEVVNNG